MLQLILGISLSLILLFVITLLVTEVALAYPQMSPSEKNIFVRLNQTFLKKPLDKSRGKHILLILSCIMALSLLAYFIQNGAMSQPDNVIVKNTAAPLKTFTTLQLHDTIAQHSLAFTVQTKWEDGQIYCNQLTGFYGRPTWSFKDWTFLLLDKDGFLIKQFNWVLNDMHFQTMPDGRIAGLVGKTKGDLSLEEYQRISKLQVILDKKIPVE